MPTYDYVCSDCGYRFDQFQQMSEEPVKVCPQCKKENVQRLISGGNGFLFKGSGFYITDYRSSNYDKAKKADTAKSDSTTASDSVKPKKAKSGV